MNPIYISGHKNPDTDSICSAIALAGLKEQLDEKTYLPVRLGELNEETKFVLSTFQVDEPQLITSVKTQVLDLAYDEPVTISPQVPVHQAWERMNDKGVNTMPVVGEDEGMIGLIAARDIANSDIQAVFQDEVIQTTMENLLATLSARQVCGGGGQIKGRVVIAKDKNDLEHEGAIVVVGWEPGIEQLAGKSPAACVILSEFGGEAQACACGAARVVTTGQDTYRAARLIYQSTPVGEVMKKSSVVSVHLEDYVDEVKELFMDTRYRSYPVLNERERVVGMISRDHLLCDCNKKQVILVDHNEIAQSIPGLEEATIFEIVDHHKLGDIQTAHPLFFRSEPVGCTATIVANMYQENGITPSKELAGIMLSAILSDTVLFKSPTCTQTDRQAAQRLADIAGVEVEQLGNDLFTAGSSLIKQGPQAMLDMDFKEFSIGGKKVGIGQITIWDVELVRPMQEQIKALMREKMDSEGFDCVLFMETSIKAEGTNLIGIGDCEKAVEAAFGQGLKDGEVYLPGVMSRKKQIVPQLTQQL